MGGRARLHGPLLALFKGSLEAVSHARLACSLLLATALLPPEASANSNRKGDWRTHRTPHFDVLYHEEVAAQADFARAFLEEAYAVQTKALGLRSSRIRITVVLTGHLDESNGFATPLGHKIVIWTRPGQVIASNDMAWLRRVLAHELAHQITFLGLRNLFGLYGELYKSSNLPVWFLEGLAQYLGESWDAKRNTFFAHALYNSALEPYPAMAAFTKMDPVDGRLVYEQGHALVRFLADRNGGPAFLGKLLRKVTVIPLWNELKALASPLTARWLPLESALLSLTGKSMARHYAEFKDTLEAGLPGRAERGSAPRSMLPGLEADVVFQARQVGPDDFIATAQEDWDRPYVSLWRVRGGKAAKLGPDFVNPVFDVSSDGRRLAYVKDYTDVDGEPAGRLVVMDLSDGSEAVLGKGAYHPAFLGGDTLAYSRWKGGRQALAVCIIAGRAVECKEDAPDSLTGFFALSRSSLGLLMNATDAAGRTGIWEWSPASGFQRILQDTVLSEFPVEGPDGRVWMIRDAGGLMQAAALDRGAGTVTPLSAFPGGTFYLHRAAPGRIASVAQVGGEGWRMAPVEVAMKVTAAPARPARPAADSAAPADTSGAASAPADTIAAGSRAAGIDTVSTPPPEAALAAAEGPTYRAPGFLQGPPLLPSFVKPPKAAAPGREYQSLLGIRPLLLLPQGNIPAELGAMGLFQDPLELHSLQASLIFPSEGVPFYNVIYTNAQTPVRVDVLASNDRFSHDRIDSGSGGYLANAVQQIYRAEIELTVSPPFDMPMPHSFGVSLAAGREWQYDRVETREDTDGDFEFTGWSDVREAYHHRIGIHYSYSLPYAYAFAHPLRETFLGFAHMRRYPGDNDYLAATAVHSFPLWDEITLTGAYRALWSFAEFDADPFELPGGGQVRLFNRMDKGVSEDAYAGIDFPLLKGYLFELPLFGTCNYAGAGVLGAYAREDYRAHPLSSRPGIDDERGAAGGRVYFLFHAMRRIPLVWAWRVQYDFDREEPSYHLSIDLGGIPSQVAGRRHRRSLYGSGLEIPASPAMDLRYWRLPGPMPAIRGQYAPRVHNVMKAGVFPLPDPPPRRKNKGGF